METKYKVVFTGQIRSGFKDDDVVQNLVAITNMDNGKAEKFISAEKPVLIKKDLDRDVADKYRARFQKAGLQIRLVRSGRDEQTVTADSPEPKTPPSIQAQKQTSPPPPVQATSPDNPYASPKADLKIKQKTAGNWLDEPQKVSASRGWHWFKSATGMFLAEPWKWMGMALVAMIMLIPLNLIPIAGALLNTLLGMLLAGGIMMAANSQAEGKGLKFSLLFKGFSHNRNQLMMIAVYYLAFAFTIGIIMALLMGTGIMAMAGFGNSDPEAMAMAMQQNMPMFFVAILVIMALSIPFVMAYWFTTPLVALAGQKAWIAYRLSFKGCLRNWLPFLVYGLVFFIISIIIMVAIGAVGGLMAFFMANDSSILLAFLPMVIMAIIGFPLIVIAGLSIFTSFKDIFYKSA